MNKKDLKMYETPVTEVISTELEGFVCTSPGSTNAPDINKDITDENFDFG